MKFPNSLCFHSQIVKNRVLINFEKSVLSRFYEQNSDYVVFQEVLDFQARTEREATGWDERDGTGLDARVEQVRRGVGGGQMWRGHWQFTLTPRYLHVLVPCGGLLQSR